ncbi:MAG: Magnesium-transporting ATPase, P-type 1 [Acidobacteriota bacterium]|jgi:Mg2+-importing ATPase
MKIESLDNFPYWAVAARDLLDRLGAGPDGLSSSEAGRRLAEFGPNRLRDAGRTRALLILLAQFKSPLVLMLVFAALISVLTGGVVDTLILLGIIIASALLGFVQEYHAGNAVERLRQRVRLMVQVRRDGQTGEVGVDEVVPGDIVLLSAGSLIPADGVVLTANDFFVNEAVMTGETFPVEKRPGLVGGEASLVERSNAVLMGTSVRSGTAEVLICRTGMGTEYGRISAHLNLRLPPTEFEQGIHHFGNMLTRLMTLLMFIVFAINVRQNKPVIDSLLFAVALAVGLAPELLPAIISITLSRGAQLMARRGVIVKKLTAIENFGSMDVLCTDKTGTLTLGVVTLDGAVDSAGQPAELVRRMAWLNANYQTGLVNPLDEAILATPAVDLTPYRKVEEIPYDFIRKRLSVAVANATNIELITKGAFEQVLMICTTMRDDAGAVVPLDERRCQDLRRLFANWSDQGFRVLGVATRVVEPREEYTTADEAEMTLLGFLLFFDPPRPETAQTIASLERLGVELKIITGDNRSVALHVAKEVGLEVRGLLTGAEMSRLHDEALWQQADRTTIFAEVDPNQKERIIAALRKMGHVVGYLGDGINDAPALHAADVGVSVDTAVDVAREAADFVLLEHSLEVLCEGIAEGRRIFANTLKYVFTTTSANFGNMFSMAGLSIFLPYLPLLPTQILLNNFLSDFPAMAIATDEVDHEMVDQPRRWDVVFIRNFMIVFGLVSSFFDYLTFGLLLLVVKVGEAEFRTGWFIESLLTELMILLVVRTRRPLSQSRPGFYLWLSTLLVSVLTIALPYLPGVGRLFNFVPLSWPVMLMLVAITLLYVIASEVAKRFFYRWVDRRSRRPGALQRS